MIHLIRKRQKECTLWIFLTYIVCGTALTTLPGFLYFYFWKDAGIIVSSLIGFVIGSFALSTLEIIHTAVMAVRRRLGHSDKQAPSPKQK